MKGIQKAVEKSLKKSKVPEILAAKIVMKLPKTDDKMEVRNFVIKELKKTNSGGLDSVVERFDEVFENELKKI